MKNCYFIYKEHKNKKMTYLKFKKFNIEVYKPGKSSFKKLKKIIKLSANESALGMSSRVKKVMSNKLFRYFSRRTLNKARRSKKQPMDE